MSENENKNINDCDCGCDNKEKTEKTLTVYDFFMGIFYAVIIFVGISLCIERGLNANIWHLVTVTVCLICVSALKIAKFRKELKAHFTEIFLTSILSAVAIFVTVANLFFN